MATTDPTPDPTPEAVEGFRPTSAHVAGRSWPVQVLGWFSSVKSAAALIAIMAVTLGVATYYERAYGRDAVAVMVFQEMWFNLLWALLALNIFGAAAVRWPWRRPQIGFVIVHVGLLTIMLGFFCDRNRLDGQLIAPPGEKVSRMDLSEDYLAVIDGTGDDSKRLNVTFQTLEHAGLPSFARYLVHGIWPLPELGVAVADRVLLSDRSGDRWRGALLATQGFPRITIGRVCLAAEEELGFAAAPTPGTGVWVAHLQLAVHTPAMPVGASQPQGSYWLSESVRKSVEVGPADVALGRIQSVAFLSELLSVPGADAGDARTLVVYQAGQRYPIALDRPLPFTVELTSELAVEVQESYDHPRFDVDAHKLSEDPEAALDPMLVVRVGVGAVAARRWKSAAAFAFHPAGVDVAPESGQPEIWYDHPAARRGGAGQGMVAQLLRTADGGCALIRISRSRGRLAGVRLASGEHHWEGALVGGEGMPMEIRLNITIIPDAEPAPVPRPMLPDNRDQAARWIEVIVERGNAKGRLWMRRDGGDNGHHTVKLNDGALVLFRYTRAQYDLAQDNGFSVVLDRFDEGKDIGGASTATFASDIQVVPTSGGTNDAQHISMNEPLRYNGVTLYQSSFIPEQDANGEVVPGRYLASVFTVATAPGRWFKYLGSGILVGGIITLYLMRRK